MLHTHAHINSCDDCKEIVQDLKSFIDADISNELSSENYKISESLEQKLDQITLQHHIKFTCSEQLRNDQFNNLNSTVSPKKKPIGKCFIKRY